MESRKHATFRIPQDVKKAFKKATSERGYGMSEMIVGFMRSYAELHEKKKKEAEKEKDKILVVDKNGDIHEKDIKDINFIKDGKEKS